MEGYASSTQYSVPPMERICGDDDDDMSILTDDIVSYILSFLSMEEAYRARLVCHRWRELRVPVLNLKLHPRIIFNSKYKYYTSVRDKFLSLARDSVTKTELWELENDFVRKVDQYLSNFPGNKLVSFNGFFLLYFWEKFASRVDDWISFAVKMEAERIDLTVWLGSSHYYTFPWHVLPIGERSHLKFLRLRLGIQIRASLDVVNRLSSLKSLDLDTVTLEERDMDVILSGCLNLESLILRECQPISTFRLKGHVPRLKRLFVESCFKISNVELDSVGLERLEYKGRMGRFNFHKLPSLTEVFLWITSFMHSGTTDFIFKCLPRDFPILQNLTLCWFSNSVMTVPANIVAFGCLTRLNLILFLRSNFNLLSITHILNACPVLEKFHLSLHEYTTEGAIPEIDSCGQQYLQLKEVAINGFRDCRNAVQLAIYLLKSAISLERMIINKRSNRYYGDDEWTYDDGSSWSWSLLTPAKIHDLLFKERINPTTELLIM